MLGVLAGAGAAAGADVVAVAGDDEEVESDALGVADEVVPRESLR